MLGKANKENSSLLNVSLLINEEESVDSKTLNDIVQKTVQYKDDKALQKQATKLENLYAKKEKKLQRDPDQVWLPSQLQQQIHDDSCKL